jgi:hypothetical protein
VALTARLSGTAFRLLCERLTVHLPEAVSLAQQGFDLPEHQAMEQLRRVGWIDHRGDVDERLAVALRVLDRPRQLVDVIRHVDGPAQAVFAANGRRAVRVVVTGGLVVVRRIAAAGLGSQAVALLPTVSEGYGRSVSLPTETLQAAASEAGDDARALHSALQRRGVSRDAAHLVAVMNRGAVSTAQFGVAVAVDDRRMRRGEEVIGWWANDSGGYLAEEHHSSSGESWTTIAPANTARLAGQIDRRLDILARTVHK